MLCYLLLRRAPKSSIPITTENGTARMTPIELDSACTISTDRKVVDMSCTHDGSMEV